MTPFYTYIVCGHKSWNRAEFDRVIRTYPGTWHFASGPAELTVELIERLKPRFVFFLHWSHRVPDEILNRCECINFHMADVPYGRGGTPLQNLITAGCRETKLAALRMIDELDAGPVYLKESLSLEGNAEEIYIRQTKLAAQMIGRIITEHPTPIPQTGEPTIFRRRKPAESGIPNDLLDVERLYDFIRMLDAEGYPKAFLTYGRFRFEFSRVGKYNGRLHADVVITENEGETQ